MKKKWIFVFLFTFSILNFLVHPCWAKLKQPTIIITDEVIEATKKVNEKAENLSKSFSDAFIEMEKLRKLFEASKCDSASPDPGCSDIKKQMQERYLAFLEQIGKDLPDIEYTIENSNDALGRRLSNVIGKGMTPRDLMNSLADQSVEEGKQRLPDSEYSLAGRLKMWLRLISEGGGKSPEVIASEIFIDQGDALYNIGLLKAQISRQRQLLALDIKMGRFNKQTIDTADKVREMIFGPPGEKPGLAPSPAFKSGSGSGTISGKWD